MELQTSIRPRRDGTVNVVGEDGVTYTFKTGADGVLSCDVADDATVARLLTLGDFYPANEQDFQAAVALAQSATPPSDDDDDGDDGDDGDEVIVLNGGAPVEDGVFSAAADGAVEAPVVESAGAAVPAPNESPAAAVEAPVADKVADASKPVSSRRRPR